MEQMERLRRRLKSIVSPIFVDYTLSYILKLKSIAINYRVIMSRFLTRTVTRLARCSAQRLVRASLAPNIFAHNLQSVQNTFPVCSQALRRLHSSESNSIHEKIDGFVKNAKVVVFMKGEQTAPQCGFSNAVVQIMRMHDVTFESHNVLADDDVRQGIKEYSNWPTIPQV